MGKACKQFYGFKWSYSLALLISFSFRGLTAWWDCLMTFHFLLVVSGYESHYIEVLWYHVMWWEKGAPQPGFCLFTLDTWGLNSKTTLSCFGVWRLQHVFNNILPCSQNSGQKFAFLSLSWVTILKKRVLVCNGNKVRFWCNIHFIFCA